ncbi:3-deoxy-7-phosphoheptulonate synthase class II [Streptomyces sp. SF28]|nr:3-deoxy-7-phosphoheptulonate synthase class II [Streptomyces pinistramenti]MCB5908045.1 3-deoxy-7-phosphoheptulonate synthase class II [Streptomyces pinistramenti]
MDTFTNSPDAHASWRNLPADQQPEWPDPDALRDVLAHLSALPPLVRPRESDALRSRLAEVAKGDAFLLQGGDCAETFAGVGAQAVNDKLETLAQMALVIAYGSSSPVVTVGRIAGQYGKPRSSPTETRNGITLPSYRGDCVNGNEFTTEARTPDPRRLGLMYQCSAATLNLVRSLTAAGHPELGQVQARNREFVLRSPVGERYERLVGEVETALALARAYGLERPARPAPPFFVSHEALLLDYESALTRVDPATGHRYAGSGHMVWIGERTRRADGAHIEYAARIRNPIGVKLGPATRPEDALALIDRLDPHREPGRLTFIIRMGSDRVRDALPPLIEAVRRSGALVAWVCDPMHGNTYTAPDGHKTRHFDTIADEVTGFFEVHRGLGTHPGGVHLELTGEPVTECVGGGDGIGHDDLRSRYETACDPRLSRGQSMDLAFLIAERYGQEERAVAAAASASASRGFTGSVESV